VIRNIVVGRLRADVPPEAVEQALQALLGLRPDGLIEMRAGRDAGLRAGNLGYAITADFVDEEAYRRYDLEEEHNRIRRELFDPISESIVRVQFVL
jgi:Stress responsive A/B Barrel Domain